MFEPPASAATSAPVSTTAAASAPPTEQHPTHRVSTAMYPPRFAPLLVLALTLGIAAWVALYAQDWQATMAADRARLAQMDVRLSALARAFAKPVPSGSNLAPPLILATQTTSSADQQHPQKTIKELEQRLASVEQRIEQHAAQLLASTAATSQGAAAAPSPPAVAPGWVLNIATLSHKKSARNLIASLANNGVKAGLSMVNVDNQVLYRVRLQGFKSQALAEQEAMRLQSILGLGGLWVAQE